MTAKHIPFPPDLTSPTVSWAGASNPDPHALLNRCKQAMGGDAWDDVTIVVSQFSAVTGGLEGTGVGIEDLHSGRYLNRYNLDAFSGANGYDGEHIWSVDPNGAVTVTEAQDEVESARNTAYRNMRAFWYPERHAAKLVWTGRQTVDGNDYDVLQITPEGGREFEMWIDAATGFIARTVETLAVDTKTTIYSDYREVDGLMIAHHLRLTDGDAQYDTVAEVTQVAVNEPVPATAFNVPEETTSEIHMTGDSVVIPFRLINNHIFVEAELNGKGPFTLLVDTGGANVLVPATMQKLGLAGSGAMRGRGSGEETAEISVTRVDSIALGGMTMSDQTFYGIDLSEVERAGGVPLDGLIGYEVFKRFVVEIDYEYGRLTLMRPETFHYTGEAQPIAFTFNSQTPQVQSSIDGFEGSVTLDTGSRTSLDVMVPFAERHDFVGRYQPKIEAITGWGLGGPVRSKVTRAGSLKLGHVQLNDVVMEIPQQKAGSLTDRYRAGNIGGGVLKRFTVTFDYQSQLMWLEPNSRHDEREIFDRSGMWINLGEEAFEVTDVVAGGPAKRVGLQPGDVLVSIDGRSADAWTLYELRHTLRHSKPGTRIAMAYRRGGQQYRVQVELEELVP